MKLIQDKITFTLSYEEAVINTSVRLDAGVMATMTPGMTEDSLKDSIRELMQRFVVADWQFSGMTRTTNRSKLEEIQLTATARVDEKDVYALDKRRTEASREGLQIYSCQADTRPSASQIAAAQSKLRQILLTNAVAELALINTTLGETSYRLGKVVFDPPVDMGASNQRMAFAATYSGDAPSAGAAAPIGNTVKITMTALVTLCSLIE